MAIKMTATSSFSGNEGFVKSGSVFEAADQERADKLKKLGLAEPADEGAEVTHEGSLSDLNKDELQDRARSLEISGFSSMNKDELVSAINEASSSNETSEPAPKPLSDNKTRVSNRTATSSNTASGSGSETDGAKG